MKWYKQDVNNHDVVISSRVRLARNLADFPFTPKLDHATSSVVAQKVTDALNEAFNKELIITEINSAKCKKEVLVEDHIISPDFSSDSPLEKILITDKSGNLAVMVNEEDHVRIQAIFNGFEMD